MSLETWVRLGGVVQLGILTASALVPRVLDWRGQLKSLDPLMRHLFWVYGAYIVLTIVALGSASIAFADELTSGLPLGRAVAAFIAVFWGVRLVIQLVLFDARPFLKTRWMFFGYHSLTAAFAFLTIVFTWAALR